MSESELPSYRRLRPRPPQRNAGNHERDTPSPGTYQTILDNAKDVLDHIRDGNVRRPSRFEKTSIVYYDYHDRPVDQRTTPTYIEASEDIFGLGTPPQDVKERVIIVEDLSQGTIDALGSTFWLNPEFFEEHLLNSGYAGADYTQPPARTWKTDSLAKSYVSIKWIRPVWRTRTYFSSQDLADLLADGTEHLTTRGRVTTRVVTNIFRSEWGLWTDPTKTIRTRRECGWEEKATIWVGRLPGCNCQFVIVLLDPLPEISERMRIRRKDPLDEQGGAEDDGLPRRVNERDLRPGIWGRLFMGQHSDKKLGLIKKKEGNELLRRVIIEQMSPRRALTFDLDQVFREQDHTELFILALTQTTSTRGDICDALNDHAGAINLAQLLFQIIYRDTLTLLEQLYRILDEIDVDMMDETKMEDRLVLWRQLINRAQRELPELKTSIRRFATFFTTVKSPYASEQTADIQLSEMREFEQLSEDIVRMTERLQKTSESLTSNMSLLESRRSIDEAHAVTRLTELAFIFIPLSFSASIFGMQVESFANPVPIWYFFVVATVATSFSYLMRLVMRSQLFHQLKADIKYDIRKYAERHGQHVQPRSLPILFILQWAGSTFAAGIVRCSKWTARIGQRTSQQLYTKLGFVISFIFLVGAVSALPIGILFTQRLDPGIRTAVCIGIILAVIATVGVPFLHMSRPTWQSAFPKLPAALTIVPRWARKGFLWLIPVVTVIVLPLALIWTRSLDPGIKVGLTIGISIIAVTVLCFAFVAHGFGLSRTIHSPESDQGSSYEDGTDASEFSSASI